jgi:hypothetical protein
LKVLKVSESVSFWLRFLSKNYLKNRNFDQSRNFSDIIHEPKNCKPVIFTFIAHWKKRYRKFKWFKWPNIWKFSKFFISSQNCKITSGKSLNPLLIAFNDILDHKKRKSFEFLSA